MKQTRSKKNQDPFFKKLIHGLDSVSFGLGKEREYLLENVSMLIVGGMTVLGAVDTVKQGVRSRAMRRTLDSLSADIESGSPLWKAFQKAQLFKEHAISLVRIGEESGKLSDNLKLMALQEAKERDFQSKIRSAMLYPVFVLSLTMIVGVLIAWFILPRLATVFAQLDVTLPTITKGLIAAGTFLGEYGHIALPLAVALFALILFFVFFFSKTKFLGQMLLFATPGIQGLIREVEITRFSYLLGTLLQAYIPITQALDSLEKASSFPHYKKLYAHLRDSIADGDSFQKSFAQYKKTRKLIPFHIQQLIVAGEQSGNLSQTLLTIHSNFETKTEQTTKNISVILEPILLVIVWLGVVAVALAVILPIYSLIGGLSADPSARIQETPPVEIPKETVATPLPEARVEEDSPVPSVRILETGIGYLNVRDTASTQGKIIGRVLPGEEYEYTEKGTGWYQIIFGDPKQSGWVYAQYVEIITTEE